MLGSRGAPKSFIGIPKIKRRDGYARSPQQSGTLSSVCCLRASYVLGWCMLFGGGAALYFLFLASLGKSQLQPFISVPAAFMVAGIIFIAVATVSAKRKARKLNESSSAAPRQVKLAYIQSFTTTTNTRSPPFGSCTQNRGSDNVRGTRSLEAKSISTGPAFGNPAVGCAQTIDLVQRSDNVPPRYEAVMQAVMHRSTYI